ncbi:MAG TPA: hypothetical protein VIP05_32840 [Burkholderiaceae bacterium]
MSTTNLYRGLFELLTLPHGDAASEMLLTSARVARRELLVVARQEGCLPELYARWASESLLSPTESAEHEQFLRRRASVAELLRALPAGTLLASADALRSPAAAIEVLLPDFAAIGPLHEAVQGLGYRLRDAGEWLVPLRGPMHRGLASFRYTAPLPGAVAVDVQVGGVPMAARRNLAFADLAARPVRLEGLPCAALAPAAQVLHRIAAFGARATPVTVREVADLHLLLKDAAQRIDPAWLKGKVEQLDAWAGLRQLREAIVAKRLGALLSWGEFGRLVESSAARGEETSRKRPREPRVAALVRNAFSLVEGPRRDDVTARLARAPWLVSRVLAAGHRVRGVPVSSKVFDAPRFVRIDGALYLATGAGLILLSLVDLGEVARGGLGERVRTGSRPVVLARWSAAPGARRSGARAS